MKHLHYQHCLPKNNTAKETKVNLKTTKAPNTLFAQRHHSKVRNTITITRLIIKAHTMHQLRRRSQISKINHTPRLYHQNCLNGQKAQLIHHQMPS